MARTTISLPHHVIVRLRVMAAERRTSMASIIREAIEEKTQVNQQELRPKPKSIGMGRSGYTDTSVRIGEERQPPLSWR